MTSIDENWERLQELIEEEIVAAGERVTHIALLAEYQEDIIDERGRLLLGWKRAPAAKRNHHAYEGGLVQHQLEMWTMWVLLAADFEYNYVWKKAVPHITDERVLKAILYHDLHKAYRTYRLLSTNKVEEITLEGVMPATEWKTEYADDATDKLADTVSKSLTMLTRVGIKLDDEQLNALLWSEGGFSHNQPKWRTALATLAYILDEFSGNVLARINEDTMVTHDKPART